MGYKWYAPGLRPTEQHNVVKVLIYVGVKEFQVAVNPLLMSSPPPMALEPGPSDTEETLRNYLGALDDHDRKHDHYSEFLGLQKLAILLDRQGRGDEARVHHLRAAEVFVKMDIRAAEKLGDEGEERLADALSRLAWLNLYRSLSIQEKHCGTEDAEVQAMRKRLDTLLPKSKVSFQDFPPTGSMSLMQESK